MNHRESALLGYVTTIAFDPRVRASKSLDDLFGAVLGCMKDDLPAVGRQMLRGGVQIVAKKVEPVVADMLGGLFKRLDGVIDGLGKKR